MKITGLKVSALLLSILVGAVLFFSFLPFFFNTLVLPAIGLQQEDPELHFSVTSLSIKQLSCKLRFGNIDNPALVVPRLTLSWSLPGLLRGEIEKIEIDGGTLRTLIADGRPVLQGFPGKTTPPHGGKTSAPSVPFRCNEIIVRNLHLLVDQPGRPTHSVDTHLRIIPDYATSHESNFPDAVTAELRTSGTLNSKMQLSVYRTGNGYLLNGELLIPTLQEVAELIHLPQDSTLQGGARITAEMIFANDPGLAESVDMRIQLNDFDLALSDLHLKPIDHTPITLAIKGTPELLNFALEDIELQQPERMKVALNGEFNPQTGDITGSGELTHANLSDPFEVTLRGNRVEGNPVVEIQVRCDRQETSFSQVNAVLGQSALYLRFVQDETGLNLTKVMNLQSLKLPQQQLLIDDLTLQTNSSSVMISPPAIRGKIEVSGIHYKGELMADLSATASPISGGVALQGALTTRNSSPLIIQFSGDALTNGDVALTLSMSPTPVDNSLLPGFINFPQEIDFSGNIALEANLNLHQGTPFGDARLTVTDGEVRSSKKNLTISGIGTEVTFPMLPHPMTSSSQELSIESIEFGTINVSDGRIFYRVEDESSLFLENVRFNWCGGRVESGSLRIQTDDTSLQTTLYCDRLQFSELLRQFGISDTEGDGSLNGRLPIHFTGKEIVFEDGFLFSTPGDGGIVRFNNTDLLRQSMPDLGKAAYLEYSLQAMQNFSYNWTKLAFNTEGENLLVKMQIDGKPESPLPYGYKSGQLVRVTAGAGIQHPIRLDVNFHLPLMQMLKYGQNLQKLMENVQ